MAISVNTNQATNYAQGKIWFSQAPAESIQNGIRSTSKAPQNGIRLLPDAPKFSMHDTAQAIKDSNMIQASDCTDWGWFPPGDPRSF